MKELTSDIYDKNILEKNTYPFLKCVFLLCLNYFKNIYDAQLYNVFYYSWAGNIIKIYIK